ncbi:TraM recognition domain-containing protein [Streptacidiphilus sp. EB129]|uniref:TraM recognition domain-containing protein n=1 Tax=Streptacidiphilus sp. EB129 TaxID=3156262 RepID=UPI003516FF1C
MSSPRSREPRPRYPGAPAAPGPDPYRAGGPGRPTGPVRRGIPDGAIIGLLGTLLGTTTLVWLSTALGGLLTHGHLPHPLPFGGTPTAIRHLATSPNDLPGAWPGTAPAELPSPFAFWTTFFVLLALLIALALTILTAWTRLRAARAAAENAPWREADNRELHGAASRAMQGTQDRDGYGVEDGAAYGEGDREPHGADDRTGYRPEHRDVHGPEGSDVYRADDRATYPAEDRPRSRARDEAAPPVTRSRSERAPQPPAGGAPAPASAAPEGPAAPGDPLAPTVPATVGPAAGSARFAFPAGTTCLLVPDPAAAAAKRELLQRAIEAATGPLLVVTDDPLLWAARPPHRDARLYDPLRLVDTDTGDNGADLRVRWAPHSRCEDPSVATSRARALLAPTGRGGTSQAEKTIQETAQTLLRCWLHAAALDGRPFRHVHRWAQGTARQEAAAILRSADPHAVADGWGGELEAVLTHATELRDAALDRILAALDALSELQVQQACTPSPANSGLEVESIIRDRGTLYLMGRATESRVSRPEDTDARGSAVPARRSAMPLLAALVEDVVEHGRRVAVRSSSGRLDPPLLCVLDSVAAVAPFPGLPELMARGGPLGLDAIAVLRSPEQVRFRWGDRAVHSLWTNADARALLGPVPAAEVAGLLGALQSSPPAGHGSGDGHGPATADGAGTAAGHTALSSEDLLLLAGRNAAQRFRIVSPPTTDPAVGSGGRTSRR